MKNKFKFLATMLIGILLSTNVWGAETWTKVSSVSEITSGGTFIIGYWDGDTDFPSYLMPMQNTGTASTEKTGYMYSGITEGECDDEYWLDMDDPGETAIYEVEISASSAVSGAVNIKCGSNYIGNENAKNCCKLYASTSATTAFTPTITDGYVTLKINANETYHTLQYNTGSPRFAVYSGTQKNLVLYKKASTSTPAITITASLTDFTYEAGAGPSAAQSFTVGGSNLTADITVTAPTNFEVSKSSEFGYASSVSLTPSTGTVSNTAIYVRMKSGLSQGTGKGGNITLSSDGATSQTIAVVGIVTAPIVKHEVRWHIGGVVTTDEVAEGAAITFPADPSAPTACDEKSFYGWAKSAIDGETEEAPTVYTSETMDTEDIDFYAVFADKEGEGENGWEKVTTVAGFIPGTYVFGYESNDGFIPMRKETDKTTINVNTYLRAGTTAGSSSASTLTLTAETDVAAYAVTIGAGSAEGTITIHNGTNYIGVGSSSGNIHNEETAEDWKPEISNEVLILKHNTSTTYIFSYNTSSPRFAAYTSSQGKPSFYKWTSNTSYSAFVTSCATYTVTWRSNDYEIRVDADKAPGTVLTAPTVSEVRAVSAKAACGDHLVGWVPAASTNNPKVKQDSAPTDMVGQQVTVTGNVVYHAVYADVEEE